MIGVKTYGDYDDVTAWLERLQALDFKGKLDTYGQMGVDALAEATPKETGKTAASWTYKISGQSLSWYNTNVNNGENVAILINYGHGTGTGGYVGAVEFITPAIQPVFDKILDEIRKEVSR